MGYRSLLIAIKGKKQPKIFEEYGVRGCNKFSKVAESDVAVSEYNDFTILYINDFIEPDDGLLKKLSVGASLVANYVNETVMVSYASCWENGKEIWNILHDSQKEVLHLESNGTLPTYFEKVKAEKMTLQQAKTDEEELVDYIFDVPVAVFYQLVGYKYDLYYEDLPWEELKRTHSLRKKKWWK